MRRQETQRQERQPVRQQELQRQAQQPVQEQQPEPEPVQAQRREVEGCHKRLRTKPTVRRSGQIFSFVYFPLHIIWRHDKTG